jgi:hypothetical protein
MRHIYYLPGYRQRSTYLRYIAGVLRSGDAQYAASAGSPLRHTVIPLDVTVWGLLFDPMEYSCPYQVRDPEVEDQGRFEGGQTERQAADRQSRGEAISSG